MIVGGYGYPNIDELIGHRFAVRGPDDPARVLVEQHETIIVGDVAGAFAQFEDPFGEGNIKSWMAVPLLVGDRLIGMLTLDSFEPDFYTAEHARTAEAFAAFAATAIDKARYLGELERAREHAETLSDRDAGAREDAEPRGHDRGDPRRAAAGRALRQLLGAGDPGQPPGDRGRARLRRSRRRCSGRASTWTTRATSTASVVRSKRTQVFADVSHNPHFASDFRRQDAFAAGSVRR